ncbi:MAG TPA: CaiB/BaiF CoA transferase family protein [Desulfobacterales bacterium]
MQEPVSRNPDAGALAGILVLDLSRLLPGPYCSMMLADHGARVIAVEDRRFQQDDFFADTVYRNKEHMTLNLKHREGRRIFHRLARNADVVLEGFRPGVTRRLAVDYATLARLNPRLIYCSITGYGQTGPLRDRAGHDVNYLAVAGVLDLIGEAGRPPVIPGVQVADIAGGLNAAVGILLALVQRTKTGTGQYIDISMADGALSRLALPLYLQQLTGHAPRRGDNRLSHRYACYNVYETADGRCLAVGAVEHRFWKALCEALELFEYVDFQYDDDRRQEIIAALRTEFRQKSAAHWLNVLSAADTCISMVNTMEEALADPLFAARGMVAAPGENRPSIDTPIRLSAGTAAAGRRPPAFGEHTGAILAELGYSAEEIRRLADEQVV